MTNIDITANSNLFSPQHYQWHICGENCLTLLLPKPVTLEQQQLCWGLAEQVMQTDGIKQWVIETVVGMNTLSVYCHELTAKQLLLLKEQLETITQNNQSIKQIQGQHIEIPVRYGGEYGPDLSNLAKQKNMTVKELVERHTAPIYTVYFIGFQPGFPYLGGLPAELCAPRHTTPRLQVPAGSVGIGGEQTGIYPFASPGGWQLLGQTDLPLFNLDNLDNQDNGQPTLLQAGDTLSFVAIEVIEDSL